MEINQIDYIQQECSKQRTKQTLQYQSEIRILVHEPNIDPMLHQKFSYSLNKSR